MANPNYRTKDEWFSLIQECRRSGMTDAQWCIANGVNRYSFYNAIKRLKACSYVIPSPHRSRDMHDFTVHNKQDVVRVDIVPDIPASGNLIPETISHIDNSHMIEITFGDVHISLSNGADPLLVSNTLSALRNRI